MSDDMTMGELVPIVRAAAPGSVRVGGYLVTYVGEFPYEPADDQPHSGPKSG